MYMDASEDIGFVNHLDLTPCRGAPPPKTRDSSFPVLKNVTEISPLQADMYRLQKVHPPTLLVVS